MKHVESAFLVEIAGHSLRLRYQPSEDAMMIDISTIQCLELVQNLRSNKSKDCLFGLLNHTVTPMGSRMLRCSILQPSTSEEATLVPRYDAVEELSTREDMFFDVRKCLRLPC